MPQRAIESAREHVDDARTRRNGTWIRRDLAAEGLHPAPFALVPHMEQAAIQAAKEHVEALWAARANARARSELTAQRFPITPLAVETAVVKRAVQPTGEDVDSPLAPGNGGGIRNKLAAERFPGPPMAVKCLVPDSVVHAAHEHVEASLPPGGCMRAGCIDHGGKDEISDEPKDRSGEGPGKMPEVVARIPVAVMEERAVQTDRHRAKGAEPHYWQRDGADRLRKDVLEAIPLGE